MGGQCPLSQGNGHLTQDDGRGLKGSPRCTPSRTAGLSSLPSPFPPSPVFPLPPPTCPSTFPSLFSECVSPPFISPQIFVPLCLGIYFSIPLCLLISLHLSKPLSLTWTSLLSLCPPPFAISLSLPLFWSLSFDPAVPLAPWLRLPFPALGPLPFLSPLQLPIPGPSPTISWSSEVLEEGK